MNEGRTTDNIKYLIREFTQNFLPLNS